jgi:sugar lactone lactonase YvrE
MTKSYTAELILDARASCGEGPIWANDRLYWIDITDGAVHVYDPRSGENSSTYTGEMVGTVVPRTSGGVAVAAQQGFCALDLGTGELTVLNDPEADNPKTRFNDGKCDPAGRFWAGACPVDEESPIGTLYRLDADLTAHAQVSGLTIPNGIVWSLDNTTMYYIDTPTYRVDAFDYDPATGEVANRRTACEIPESMGWPDGMSIDAKGHIWIGMWGGHGVTHWNPETGEYLGKIEVPAAQVTACAFGGPNLEDLYITSARRGRSAPELKSEPNAGGLFKANVGVQGIPAHAFAG